MRRHYPFEDYVREAGETGFIGWNFESMTKTGRVAESPMPWNYYNVVLPFLRRASSLLDMGSGGGEVLSSFQPLPPDTCATEQYEPNIAVAKKRLEPLGASVFGINEEPEPPYNASLPFEDGRFDLVINRHEAYYPPEVRRILKRGGTFITQQVGALNFVDLKQLLLGKTVTLPNWNLKSAVDELKSAKLSITRQQEDIGHYRFYDVGAVAWYLKAIPWTVDNFTIEKYRKKLREIHQQIEANGYFDTVRHRFFVMAVKKG